MNTDVIGKELLGQFRIVERIGRGGMGEVFRAEQPEMDRQVAIKILHHKLASRRDLVSRFRREARAMSRLTHPNTVRVFLYGQLEDTGQLYIVMEYLDGSDLARLTRKDGPMNAPRAARVMIQVLGALEEAHAVGVIHRDLKPENILLTNQGGIADFPKVLDFGLAKIRENKSHPASMVLTREGMVFGTPEFMSPEQARGEVLDSRSDVYSAGVIMYELLTAQLPFPRCKPMEYIAHHINTAPIPVTERRPDLRLPTELDLIIAKALEKKREDRFQSAGEFAVALQAILPQGQHSATAMRAVPSSTPPGASTKPRPRSTAPPAAAAGKKLVIGLLVVIALLLATVICLIATQNDAAPTVVPAQNPALHTVPQAAVPPVQTGSSAPTLPPNQP